jgi:hypothetical protein
MMPGWLFWLLWMGASLFGLLRGTYRLRKYGAVRPIQPQRALRFGKTGLLQPLPPGLASQVELAVWALAVCGGLVFGLVKVIAS